MLRTGPTDARPSRGVLVVDDVPQIVEMFARIARRIRDFDVRLTPEVDSERALDLVQRHAFDLVISDYRMPRVDGIALLAAARRRNPRGLRILLTGYNDVPASLDRIREAGVDAYVPKPFPQQDLALLVLDFLYAHPATLERWRAEARGFEEAAAGETAPQGG